MKDRLRKVRGSHFEGKNPLLSGLTLLLLCGCLFCAGSLGRRAVSVSGGKDFIKWVDFDVSYEALCKAYELDVETYGQPVHVGWVELLACVAARRGGDFPKGSEEDLVKVKEQLCSGGTTLEELTKDLKYYPYYKEAYEAVLGGMVGEYELDGEQKYGLKAYLPIAKGFEYSGYDDFGSSRTYGFKREHLGHDMMGQIGTPIIAVESGYVEALGWNQYGGWRIGIRSFDKKRYYYYAHLRQNFPYCKTLREGDVVTAGDVIGYMGHTGYSKTENVNNIEIVHLHFGMQLIFDESQKDCDSEIWIDVYALTRFLNRNRSETVKNEETKEWVRTSKMVDPAVEEYLKKQKK
ncbi:MAG: M23 family metallopeptidase [Lachnospiraceae bacterium]|nr:M23 family metallopeptidase [Lachnospiraceae bacterium]